ncbi:DeoR family transcriptional regulator (plasmid) [Natrinema zhouii]|nr:DeoR family transcriptional regulator [Natrinema zhouii]
MEAVQNDEEYSFTNPRTEAPHIATEETKEMYSRYDLGEHVDAVREDLRCPRPGCRAGDHRIRGRMSDRIVRETGPALESTTTGEVAKELDCHRNTARRNLNNLAESGKLKKTKRSRSFLWQTV